MAERQRKYFIFAENKGENKITIPYHTHQFTIPVATKQDILEGTSADKAAVPASLGTAAAADAADFATAAQGLKADNAAPAARIINTGAGLSGGGDLSNDITLALSEDTLADIAAAQDSGEQAQDTAMQAKAQAEAAAAQAAKAGDVHEADLGALAFKSRVAPADIAASGDLSAATVLCGDGVWRAPPAQGGSGGDGGDMSSALYDPHNKRADVFDMDNMAEGRAAKILTAAERAKLSGLPDNAAADTVLLQAGQGLAGGGDLSGNVTLRLSDASLASLTRADTAAQQAELGALAYKAQASAADIAAGGTRSDKTFLRGDGVWAEAVSGSALPAGMIAPFACLSPPKGWLECNGAEVSRADYAALFAVLGTVFGAGDGANSFNLPDLRGEFIRGFDNGRNADAGRAFGSAQADALQNIEGSFSVKGAPNIDAFTEASGAFKLGAAHTKQRMMNRAGDVANASPDIQFDASHTARTAAETRPRNIALFYCIKY